MDHLPLSTSDTVTPNEDGKTVRIKGWVEEVRDLGGISFLLIRDGYGTIQVTVLKKSSPAAVLETVKGISRESVLEIEGTVKKSDKARRGIELLPLSIRNISAAETPLPMGVVDKVDVEVETRFDNRFMDLRKKEKRLVFSIRSDMTLLLREKLAEMRFVEVNTPKIVSEGAEGGATLFNVDYFGRKAYLAQSPQLYKQILMASGLNRIYEMAPVYRAEPSDTVRHTSEYVSFDAEIAFIDGMEDVMSTLEELMSFAIERTTEKSGEEAGRCGYELMGKLKRPFPRLKYTECIDMLGSEGKHVREGDDIDTEGEKVIGSIMRDRGYDMYFITMYPSAIKPFYIMEEDGTPYSYAFDLEYRGTEMASGGQREHRYGELVRRMESKNLNPRGFEFYLKAFRYGMPPHGGWGLGLERLISTYMSLGNLREAILFPRDRVRLVP